METFTVLSQRLLGNISLATSAKFGLLPIIKVLIICSLGCLLACRRVGILSPSGNKLLNKLVFAVFLPSLIFTELGSAITLEKMLQWWFIPVNVVLAAVTGCTIGCILVLIVRPPREFVKFTIVMTGIGNIGNIPLVLISAVCGDEKNPFGDSDSCNTLGVAYISFGQWVGAIIVYTFAYHMLAPPKGLPYSNGYSNSSGYTDKIQSSLSVKLLGDEANPDEGSFPERKWLKEKVHQAVQVGKAVPLKDIFQPPVTASILALIVGATPVLKSAILTEDAPLYFLTDCMSILGAAMIPCILLALGGNLEGGPSSSKLGLRTTVAITFTRLFVVPPVGIGVVSLADKLGFLPAGNPLFRFVLLLQHTMPTSILAGSVAALRGVAEKEAAAVLFWEHIFALLSVGVWLIVYLNILF